MTNNSISLTEEAHICLVTDLTTGEIDGRITRGGVLQISGVNIQIEKGNGSTNQSIFFISEHQTVGVDTPLITNQPETIKLLIPDSLYEEEYTLKITTRFSGKDKKLLKQDRSFIYLLKLTIIK